MGTEGVFCIRAFSLHHREMVGAVSFGAESSRKDLHLHSMLGHRLLLVRAGFAAERLCTVGPACRMCSRQLIGTAFF